MDIPYKVKIKCCSLLLPVYFHKVALLQQIIPGSKMITFSGAVTTKMIWFVLRNG